MEPTDVTKQLGTPLIVQEISRGVNPDDPFDDDGLRMRTGICTSLHIDIDPDSKTWGETLPGWRRKMGHFLVARQDRQDITFDQLSAIVGYIDALSNLMFKSLTRRARKQLL
ncbi:843b0b41-df29-4f3d-9dc2-6d95667a1866-CDS [Sclerotinia trifoliorum]|uniref:843b0b41-df29-4f3d-9dc2-6d95667a1866-CDS n=1 Tax=Sclerotinia trifoliorum TaxID=28548 RepID=A0A8H2VX46_9HELO|nr:843b0b41-df29-4f3d-9dc2-6d95667a1866-CDS [Sclerotinia trifoliorum]